MSNITKESLGHVLLIGLDRVAKRNAFDPPMFHDLARAYGEYDARLTELVEQILPFASVRAGMVIRERATVSVSQVIKAASQEVHTMME